MFTQARLNYVQNNRFIYVKQILDSFKIKAKFKNSFGFKLPLSLPRWQFQDHSTNTPVQEATSAFGALEL